MADRCDHCMARMDGYAEHADDCPVRGPEIIAENETLKSKLKEVEARHQGIGEKVSAGTAVCICGSQEADENYLQMHRVTCFWYIREERDRYREALESISITSTMDAERIKKYASTRLNDPSKGVEK